MIAGFTEDKIYRLTNLIQLSGYNKRMKLESQAKLWGNSGK